MKYMYLINRLLNKLNIHTIAAKQNRHRHRWKVSSVRYVNGKDSKTRSILLTLTYGKERERSLNC